MVPILTADIQKTSLFSIPSEACCGIFRMRRKKEGFPSGIVDAEIAF